MTRGDRSLKSKTAYYGTSGLHHLLNLPSQCGGPGGDLVSLQPVSPGSHLLALGEAVGRLKFREWFSAAKKRVVSP